MFKITNDFFTGLGIYSIFTLISLGVLFYVLKTYKKIQNPPILTTVIIFLNYSCLVTTVTMLYYSIWETIANIGLTYLILIGPIFNVFFISTYYHSRKKTRYEGNIFLSSVLYFILLPLCILGLLWSN